MEAQPARLESAELGQQKRVGNVSNQSFVCFKKDKSLFILSIIYV